MNRLKLITITLAWGILLISNYVYADAWIDGTPGLYEESRSLIQNIERGNKAHLAPAMADVDIAPKFKPGDLKTFYAIDMRNNSQYLIEASCDVITDKAYVFIEKGDSTDINKINSLLVSFNQIYEKITAQFGAPPDDVDNDPRIYMLIMDIRDGALPNGVRMMGYFSPIDQFRNIDIPRWVKKRSNEANMLYIDYISLNAKKSLAESVVAHEFMHLIEWGRDPEESTWVNEGISVYVESMLGYEVSDRISAFEGNPNTSLLDWNDTIENYGAAYLFFAYISEKFGGSDTIAAIVKNQNQDTKGIEQALADQGKSASFSDIFSNWVVANYLDNPDLNDGIYGYSTLDIHLNPSVVETQYPITRKTSRVLPWTAQYTEFKKEKNETMSLTVYDNDDDDVNARIIKISDENKVDVSPAILSRIQPNTIFIPRENIKDVLIITSQPDPPNSRKDSSVFAYSAEVQKADTSVSSSNNTKYTTWGKIKS